MQASPLLVTLALVGNQDTTAAVFNGLGLVYMVFRQIHSFESRQRPASTVGVRLASTPDICPAPTTDIDISHSLSVNVFWAWHWDTYAHNKQYRVRTQHLLVLVLS